MAVTLEINNQVYRTWTEIEVTRSLKRGSAMFSIETPGEVDPPILPFASCILLDDGEPLISGYVDTVGIRISARASRTRITGRSKNRRLDRLHADRVRDQPVQRLGARRDCPRRRQAVRRQCRDRPRRRGRRSVPGRDVRVVGNCVPLFEPAGAPAWRAADR